MAMGRFVSAASERERERKPQPAVIVWVWPLKSFWVNCSCSFCCRSPTLSFSRSPTILYLNPIVVVFSLVKCIYANETKRIINVTYRYFARKRENKKKRTKVYSFNLKNMLEIKTQTWFAVFCCVHLFRLQFVWLFRPHLCAVCFVCASWNRSTITNGDQCAFASHRRMTRDGQLTSYFARITIICIYGLHILLGWFFFHFHFSLSGKINNNTTILLIFVVHFFRSKDKSCIFCCCDILIMSHCWMFVLLKCFAVRWTAQNVVNT